MFIKYQECKFIYGFTDAGLDQKTPGSAFLLNNKNSSLLIMASVPSGMTDPGLPSVSREGMRYNLPLFMMHPG